MMKIIKSCIIGSLSAVVMKADGLSLLMESSPSSSSSLSLSQMVRRRLSYALIAYYEPKSQVTDHNAIDLDQEAIEYQLSLKTDKSFAAARDIYTKGGYSKSVAIVTLTAPLTYNIQKGTPVTGKNSDGGLVVVKVYDDYSSGTSTIGVQYKTTDNQKSYMTCQVGGLPDPNMDGCLAASGTLKIDGINNNISYSYDPKTKNINKRTIQGFSTGAEAKMYRCDNCPYRTYQKFKDYYGAFDYADQWINAAFDKKSTAFARGNANFARYGYVGRSEAIKKATAYMSIWMYVIREMEDALDDCKEGCTLNGCNNDPVHAWDEAVAFYTGSLEGTDGSGSGKLAYALADKRCENFKTCGDMASKTEGTSHVNKELIFPGFSVGSRLLSQGKCAEAKPYKDLIERFMVVPLIQGTLRYAYFTSTDVNADEKAEAEGAVFAASILPIVHACDEDAATTIYKNMKTGQDNTANYGEVKNAFESVYGCLGIRGSDIGGLYNPETGLYFVGAEPMKYASSKRNNVNIGLIVGCVIAGIVGGVILYFVASKLCGGGDSGNNKNIETGDKPNSIDNDVPVGENGVTNSDGEAVVIS